MHIPDGYLDLRISTLFYALSLAYLLLALTRVRSKVDDEYVALFTTLAVAIFAGQLLDWPVPGGTTAHFTGGALAGILLGPFGGSIVMTIVLVIQALLFGDGGILSLGANIWNIGVVAPVTGYTLYRVLAKTHKFYGALLGAFLGGFLGSVFAAFFAGLELGLSTIFLYPITVTIPAMVLYHVGFGLIDGLVTAGVIWYALRYHPSILRLAMG